MFAPSIKLATFMWLVSYLAFVGLVICSTAAYAGDISWRSNSARTSDQGAHYAYEGTAIFTGGDEPRLLGNGTRDENSSPKNGTGSGEVLYTFKDGSSFTIRFLSIWNEAMSRNAGIFTSGTGRFAGIFGTCTAAAERPTSGPTTTVWSGTYDLAPK